MTVSHRMCHWHLIAPSLVTGALVQPKRLNSVTDHVPCVDARSHKTATALLAAVLMDGVIAAGCSSLVIVMCGCHVTQDCNGADGCCVDGWRRRWSSLHLSCVYAVSRAIAMSPMAVVLMDGIAAGHCFTCHVARVTGN